MSKLPVAVYWLSVVDLLVWDAGSSVRRCASAAEFVADAVVAAAAAVGAAAAAAAVGAAAVVVGGAAVGGAAAAVGAAAAAVGVVGAAAAAAVVGAAAVGAGASERLQPAACAATSAGPGWSVLSAYLGGCDWERSADWPSFGEEEPYVTLFQ